ncbi:Serine/threonine-protein phosphatase BSL3 [Hibiscus syriacus]|uniref:Serine/threonine-protein phosphatase BSL3 n=1 Tax=Hibiscus syriacus TaxID=106335 RepID=A0A6A3BVC8_HIBSY|nr:Serine/threonine-protein phosphatase BSL3 [Hibiscus syriacus]
MSKGFKYLVEASAAEAEAISATLAAAKARQVNGEAELPDRDRGAEATPVENKHLPLLRCLILLGGMVRQLSIDQFENEGRRVSYGTPENATAARKLSDRQMSISSVPKKVIEHLLKPRGWKPPVRRQLFLDCNEIADLCENAEKMFSVEPTVLQLKAPIKIFGDLNGQFGDLMRLFDEYGSPSTAGDIAQVHLQYGTFVFHRLGDHYSSACFEVIHKYDGLCYRVRDGIWAWHLDGLQIMWNKLRICSVQLQWKQARLFLWIYYENDSVEGLRPNTRGPGLVTFGPDRVMEFCNNNDPQLIVRAHECVMDGFSGTFNHSFLSNQLLRLGPTPTRGRPQVTNDRGSLAWV